MELGKLEQFAVDARRELMRSVSDKIDYAMQEGNALARLYPQAVKELLDAVKKSSKDAVVEKTAYVWFNRFCALRFMDVNGYTDSGVVTPPFGGTIPGILAEARDGNFDEVLFGSNVKERVRSILSGAAREDDPNAAAYRVLFIATCNAWNARMPFLFEKLGDWTEILLPDDLLSSTSILAKVRTALTPEVCADVEVIGWLYQFYISEKKSKIEEGFKKNVKASAENIPAVTQLFTPHWIVKYLVQNSLGRLWMRLHPESTLVTHMEYYVPDDPEHPTPVPTDIERPEDIKVNDPCCGSAHMLIYAFDILYLIYEECGYAPAEIPNLILKYNLYGLELDPRAAALSCFALVMKARSKYSRFLRNPTMPNICAIEAIKFTPDEKKAYMDRLGRDLFTEPFLLTLDQFEEADNFGSLIVPHLQNAADIEPVFVEKNFQDDLLYYVTHQKVLKVLEEAAYLSPRYHVVVTNPPYLGTNFMNAALKMFAEDNYPKSKADMFSMFIERCFNLCRTNGFVAMITMQSWMFLGSFKDLRDDVLTKKTILSMAHLGPRAFDTIGGEVVSTSAFVLDNSHIANYRAGYIRLVDGENEADKANMFALALAEGNVYRTCSEDYKFIPGSPIAYWTSEGFRRAYENPQLGLFADAREGMSTANNDRFIRLWHEVSRPKIGYEFRDRNTAKESGLKWFPYAKGGEYRKWYGNSSYVVNWENDGDEIQHFSDEKTGRIRSHNYNLDFIFRECLSWTRVSSDRFCIRFYPAGHLCDSAGACLYPKSPERIMGILGYLNTDIVTRMLRVQNPSIVIQCGDVSRVPLKDGSAFCSDTCDVATKLRDSSQKDWDTYETSWGFARNPLIEIGIPSIAAAYLNRRDEWKLMCEASRMLEEENNQHFVESYGLQEELGPSVPWHEITLTCNPWYRYGKVAPEIEGQTGMPTDPELEARLKTDTVKELISYAVGCMMGRYSLEKPGLILADQGAGEADYYAKVGVSKEAAKFQIDDDGIIPILDNDWFADDIVTRFKEFIKVAFGEEHFFENMAWIEEALGKDLRDYFTKDFYKDHLRRYQNRPIYWLFQSPKGAFRALVYMHRYKPDMVGGVLGYLRSLQTKVENQLGVATQIASDESKSSTERVRANKEVVKYSKMQKELDEYEKHVLYPLSTERIEIDLDDGVKVNYKKFGVALRKVAALEGKGE